MTQDFKQAALEIADLIFDRIEKDRSLIKQNIADVVEKELVFRFQKPEAAPTIVPHIAKPGWAPAPDFPQYVPTVTTDNTGGGAPLGRDPLPQPVAVPLPQHTGGIGGLSIQEVQKLKERTYEKLRRSMAEYEASWVKANF